MIKCLIKINSVYPGMNLREIDHFHRIVVHIDMDCYYAQCEMKNHNISKDQPMAVIQWDAIVAMNYACKATGVKRRMTWE